MPTSTSSPLSYQTTMPEYPDVTYGAYQNATGYSGVSRFSTAIGNWWDGNPNYETWRTNLLDEYNAKMSAYNTWLQTGAGQRASLESGGYNASYFGGQNASAEGINPGTVSEGAGYSEMAQGISGIFNFARALQDMSLISAQIAGQKEKNSLIQQQAEAQRINNQYLGSILGGRLASLNFQNDKRQFELEQLFYPRWSSYPELWKGGVFSPYGRGSYDLRDANLGFGYQRAVADLDYIKAGKALRESQDALTKASKREKDWYIDNMQQVQKDILDNSLKLLTGEVKFQPIEQKLRKAGIIANISVGVINAAVNAAKAFIPAVNAASGAFTSTPGWSVLGAPSASPNLGSGNGGLDFSGFGSFSPYE